MKTKEEKGEEDNEQHSVYKEETFSPHHQQPRPVNGNIELQGDDAVDDDLLDQDEAKQQQTATTTTTHRTTRRKKTKKMKSKKKKDKAAFSNAPAAVSRDVGGGGRNNTNSSSMSTSRSSESSTSNIHDGASTGSLKKADPSSLNRLSSRYKQPDDVDLVSSPSNIRKLEDYDKESPKSSEKSLLKPKVPASSSENDDDDDLPPPPALTHLQRQQPQGRRQEPIRPGAQRIRPSQSVDEQDPYDDDFYDDDDGSLDSDTSGRSNLVHAHMVNQTDDAQGDDEELPEAEPLEKENKTRRRILFCIIICLLLILTITLSVELTKQSNNTLYPSTSPSMMPSVSPSFSSDALLSLLRKDGSFDNGIAIDTPGTPQNRAANWLIGHEGNILLHRYSDDRILQRYAMAVFYFSLGGDFWLNNENWLNQTRDECEWYLQSENPCSLEDRTLKDMILQQNLLSGSIPPEIGLLDELETLDLTFNDIEGTLPTEVGFMEDLENMILSANKLTGTIPSAVFVNLTNLEILALDHNEFVCVSGNTVHTINDGYNLQNVSMFPPEFWTLTNLQVASVGNNDFGGDSSVRCILPSDVGKLTDLERLSLEHLSIKGPIPSEIGLLSNMVSLVLPNERILEAPIPTEFGRLTRLLSLDLDEVFGFFTGTLPSEVGQMTALQEISARSVFGELFTEIGQLVQLKSLEIKESFLTSGPLPTEIGLATSLTSIEFEQSQLSGTIPSEIGLLTRLEHLSFEGLERTFVEEPSFPTDPNGTTSEAPKSKGLNGTIPTEIGLLTRLTYLSVSNTFVSGLVPSEIDLLSNLISLLLDRSELDGTIEDIACSSSQDSDDIRRIPFGSVTVGRVECSCCLFQCIVEEIPDPYAWPPENTSTLEMFVCTWDNGTKVS